MAKLFVTLLSLLAVSLVSARQTGSTCALNMETIEKDAMECVAHDPSFMLQIVEHMNKPDSMASMNFICDNQKDVVDLLLCMESKLLSCYPDLKDTFTQVLPTKQRWEDVMKFVCENRNELQNECMDNQVQDIMQCYMGKLATLSVTSSQDIQAAVCRVIRLEEQCIQEYHGTCSQKFVDLLFKVLEKFFPMDKCPVATVDIKQGQNPFSNMLIHGQPLRFQPKGEANYQIVQA